MVNPRKVKEIEVAPEDIEEPQAKAGSPVLEVLAQVEKGLIEPPRRGKERIPRTRAKVEPVGNV